MVIIILPDFTANYYLGISYPHSTYRFQKFGGFLKRSNRRVYIGKGLVPLILWAMDVPTDQNSAGYIQIQGIFGLFSNIKFERSSMKLGQTYFNSNLSSHKNTIRLNFFDINSGFLIWRKNNSLVQSYIEQNNLILENIYFLTFL